jgi:hypothetical protein
LIPVIARVRLAGDRTTAISNTRQIVEAFLIYATDNNDYFPLSRNITYGYWLNEVGLIHSGKPTLRDPRFSFTAQPGHIYESLAGYALNECLRPDLTNRSMADHGSTVLIAPATFFRILSPAQTISAPVVTLGAPDVFLQAQLEQIYPGRTVTHDGDFGSERYFGSGIYGFLDGHIKSHRAEDFERPADGACGFRSPPPSSISHSRPRFFVSQSL